MSIVWARRDATEDCKCTLAERLRDEVTEGALGSNNQSPC